MAQSLWLSECDFSMLPVTSLLMPIQLSKMLPKSWIPLLSWMSAVIRIECWIFRRVKIVQVMPGYNGKCLLLTFLITFWFPTENGASAFTAAAHHSSVSPITTEACDYERWTTCLMVIKHFKEILASCCHLGQIHCTFFCEWWSKGNRQLANVIKLDFLMMHIYVSTLGALRVLLDILTKLVFAAKIALHLLCHSHLSALAISLVLTLALASCDGLVHAGKPADSHPWNNSLFCWLFMSLNQVNLAVMLS